MSREKNQQEAERWLLTAEEDLSASRHLRKGKHHPQACFFAQQAGEKALKAVWFFVDADPWGHSIQKLVMDFDHPEYRDAVHTLTGAGAILDKFYIPTRYPNGLPDLTPGQSYQDSDAEAALTAADTVVNTAAAILREKRLGAD